MTELGQLEKLVKERIKQAVHRKIHYKIDIILDEFGERESKHDRYGLSSEDRIFYRAGRLLIQEITVGETLFDSYGTYGSASSTWREVLFDDTKVYQESHYYAAGGIVHYPIKMYISGEWEEWLKEPYAEASKIIKKKEKQKREGEEKWRAEEQRRKTSSLQENFGLRGK